LALELEQTGYDGIRKRLGLEAVLESAAA